MVGCILDHFHYGETMNQHDNLRDNIGQIIADYATEHTDPNGETGIDWCSSRDIDPVADKIVALIDAQRPALTVWYGSMPESNGKSNFTAVLHRKDSTGFDAFTDGITIERSEHPDRVRYEADKVSWIIGEREVKPELWDEGYDFDKHSGYVRPETREQKLAASLKRMCDMHDAMFKQVNVGASFFGGETLQEMNEAPIEARRLLEPK